MTLTTHNAHQSSTSLHPLPQAKHSWKVQLGNIGHWMMLGISSSNVNVPTGSSYSYIAVYGWACRGQVYIAGANNQGHGGWVGFTSNTLATYTYDPDVGSLTLLYNGNHYTINTGKLAAAYIQFDLFCQGTTLTFMQN
jgi:hypothetical protein